MDLHVRRSLTRWGNGWGLRLTKKEVERLGLKPGQPVDADLAVGSQGDWMDRFPSFDLGGTQDLDALYEDDLAEELQRGRR